MIHKPESATITRSYRSRLYWLAIVIGIVGMGLASLILITGTAITNNPTSTPQPVAYVDDTVQLRPANHRQAPVMSSTQAHLLWAWAGADEQEARLYSALWQPETSAYDGIILALKAFYPQDLTLTPIDNNTYHLLWRDAESDGETLRLRSGVISTDGVARVGALTLSDRVTHDYAVLSLGEGRLLVAYTVGEVGDTVLYTRIIDRAGRPSFAQRQASDSSDVNLVRSPDGIIRLYWRNQTTLWQAIYEDNPATLSQDDTLLDVRRFGQVISPEGGSILGLQWALQGDYIIGWLEAYDATGERLLSWASTPYIDGSLDIFQPLRFTITSQNYASGYNGGQASRVTLTNNRPVDNESSFCDIRWLTPTPSSEVILPTAINCANNLGVLFWENGVPAGYLPIVTHIAPQLAPPQIVTDSARHLSLTWASTITNDDAYYHFKTTRQ